MSILRTLLVDDDPLALTELANLLHEIDDIEILGTACDSVIASEMIVRLRPDLVFLNIQMPEQNGLRIAAMLPEKDRPEIVFITTSEQYAVEAFAIGATDYLLKPIARDRLWQAIQRVKKRVYPRSLADRADKLNANINSAHNERFWVQTRKGAIFVPIEEINWIEAARDYVILHTSTRSHLVRLSMRSLEERLGANQLARVHRSAFARLNHVVEVQKAGKIISALIMRDGAIIQVGPNYSSTIATMLNLSTPA